MLSGRRKTWWHQRCWLTLSFWNFLKISCSSVPIHFARAGVVFEGLNFWGHFSCSVKAENPNGIRETHFSESEMSHYEHLKIETRTVRWGQRAHKHFELQFVADVGVPFAGPYLLNFKHIFRKAKWVTMNIWNLKLEQFDESNALANISSCNLLRMCAHPLLDPTCWTSNSFFGPINEPLWTFKNWN